MSGFNVEYQLIFGRNIPGTEATVTDNRLSLFQSTVIDPKLDCYSLIDSVGVWEGDEEQNLTLSVCGHTDDADLVLHLREIAENYRDTFAQDCVLFKAIPLLACEFI